MRHTTALISLLLLGSACGGSDSPEIEVLAERIEELTEHEEASTATSQLPAVSTTMPVSTTTTAVTTTGRAPSTTTTPVDSTTTTNVSEGSEPPPRRADRYSCIINDAGYCIFTGQPHQNFLKPLSNVIVNLDAEELFSVSEAIATNSVGEILQAGGTPAFDGDELVNGPQTGMTEDEKAFHRVMAIMFGIRNQLMYNVEALDTQTWESYTAPLTERKIKETTFTNGATPRDNYYGRDGILELATNPNGRDIHHDVMKFLEESGLYLLCHVTSDEFAEKLAANHPEGHDPCRDAGVVSKVPFAETD